MSKVRICIQDDCISAVYCDDPLADVAVYVLDSDYDTELNKRVSDRLDEQLIGLEDIGFDYISPYDFENEETEND